MTIPVEIIFRNAERSAAVEEAVEERAQALPRAYDRLMSCRVVIERLGRNQPKGSQFRARIDLKLPGQMLVVGRAHASSPPHDDIYLAIRHAFDAANRRLQDFARKRRGDIKTHETPPHGRVTKLFPEEGYGFIELADGQEIYFHRNAVVNNAFEKLEIGSEVRVSVHVGESEKGPQAGTVKPIGRHHIVVQSKAL